MTLNDEKLNERCLKVRQLAEQLPQLMRNGDITELSIALYSISWHAQMGRNRMADMGIWCDPRKEPMGG